jgi:hypothetical protein
MVSRASKLQRESLLPANPAFNTGPTVFRTRRPIFEQRHGAGCCPKYLIRRTRHAGRLVAPILVNMTDVFSQTIQASRIFRKSPAFAMSALAILTLGIGANTAIFSVVNAVLLKPLPFPDADEIVTLAHVPPPTAFPGLKTFAVSIANYLDWRKQNSVFASMSAWSGRALQMGGSRPQALKVTISEPGSSMCCV